MHNRKNNRRPRLGAWVAFGRSWASVSIAMFNCRSTFREPDHRPDLNAKKRAQPVCRRLHDSKCDISPAIGTAGASLGTGRIWSASPRSRRIALGAASLFLPTTPPRSQSARKQSGSNFAKSTKAPLRHHVGDERRPRNGSRAAAKPLGRPPRATCYTVTST